MFGVGRFHGVVQCFVDEVTWSLLFPTLISLSLPPSQPLPGAMDEWTELDTGAPTKLALHFLHTSEGSIDQKKYPFGSSCVGLFVNDINALHAKMVEHGATVASPPEKQAW